MWSFLSRKTRRSQISRPAGRRQGYHPRLEALEDRCLLSAGALDPTFNPTGIPPGTAVVAINAPSGSGAYSAVVQPSGKIVLAGYSFHRGLYVSTLVEFDSNGSLDPNFGSSGILVTTKSTAPFVAEAAVLYPTGSSGEEKILVVGPALNSEFALARYNADGSLDTSFSQSGTVDTSFKQGRGPGVDGVVLVPNGTSLPKIVMAGSSSNDTGIELARYNPDGRLDQTFGTKGTVYTPISGGISVTALALDPVNGDLIVAGGTGLVAFKSNGTLDTSFGVNGVASFGGSGLAVYAAADLNGNAGKIVVAGGNGVARYNVNGTLDTSWGGTGIVTAVSAQSVAIQADDKVVVASRWNVARFNTDGSLDSSFGSGGTSTSGLGGGDLLWRQCVTLQPNGDIVQAGTSIGQGSNSAFAVARYLPSGPDIGSLTATPNPITSGTIITLTASNITDDNPGATITQVAFYIVIYNPIDNTVTATLLGYGTNNNNGSWTYSFDTTGLASGSYTLYAVITDSFGVIGDPIAPPLIIK